MVGERDEGNAGRNRCLRAGALFSSAAGAAASFILERKK
jgi:hypothetical protein